MYNHREYNKSIFFQIVHGKVFAVWDTSAGGGVVYKNKAVNSKSQVEPGLPYTAHQAAVHQSLQVQPRHLMWRM